MIYKKDTQKYECTLYDENSDSVFSCDFEISPKKFQELQEKIKNKQYVSKYEHLYNDKDWNNYGVNKRA